MCKNSRGGSGCPLPPYSSLDRYYLIIWYVYIYCSRARDLDNKDIKFLHILLSYSYASMYNIMMATTKAETCSC